MRRHLGIEAPALHAVLMAAWLCLPACALAQSPSAEDISSGKYCANCHANAHLIWAGKHGTKADSRAPVSVGCMMCHGDPAEHVKSPANPMPRRFSKLGMRLDRSSANSRTSQFSGGRKAKNSGFPSRPGA